MAGLKLEPNASTSCSVMSLFASSAGALHYGAVSLARTGATGWPS